MAPCVRNGTRLPRAAGWPKATVLVVILVIMGTAAAEGWTLPDVTTLIVAVTAAAGLGTVAARARLALARRNP